MTSQVHFAYCYHCGALIHCAEGRPHRWLWRSFHAAEATACPARPDRRSRAGHLPHHPTHGEHQAPAPDPVGIYGHFIAHDLQKPP
jgi:hypothetical protein